MNARERWNALNNIKREYFIVDGDGNVVVDPDGSIVVDEDGSIITADGEIVTCASNGPLAALPNDHTTTLQGGPCAQPTDAGSDATECPGAESPQEERWSEILLIKELAKILRLSPNARRRTVEPRLRALGSEIKEAPGGYRVRLSGLDAAYVAKFDEWVR